MNSLYTLRNILLASLEGELTLNKILIQNSFQQTCCTSSSQPEGSDHAQEMESEVEMEEKEDSEEVVAVPKIGHGKLSHNSSLRNDTKNIPKNYGKAILSFIQKSPKSRKLAAEMGIQFADFMMQVRRMKKKVNSIEGLKKMWGADDLEHKVRKCIRILSYQFMRKHCLRYIFHSKVRNYGTHIKYRQKLIEGIENPVAFNHIKDF